MYITAKGLGLALSGATNNWTITGTVGGSRYGTAKNDVFYSSAAEKLYGGAGDDVYNLYNANATVIEGANQGIDTINVYFWGGINLPDNVENVFLLSPGANWATGNALNNVIVAGTAGATLDGGAGDDVLVGGVGADIFKVKAGNGSDAIVNFTPGWDVVKLSGYGITSFTQLKSLATQVGADVKFQLSASETLVLRGVQLSALSAADFNLPIPTHVAVNADHVLSGANQAYNYNGWYLFNNTWGTAGLTEGKDFSISSSFNSKDMTGGATFNWAFPVVSNLTTNILAFPEVIFGNSPMNTSGSAAVDTAKVFPLKLSDMVALNAKFDVSFGGNLSGFDVAYDIWFSKSATATGKDAVSNELMIWVHKGSFDAYGDKIGTFTQGDINFTIYHTGTYTALVADKDVPSGTLDIAAIIAKLTAMGIMSGDEYLRSVELGAEVVSGAGWLTINDLDLTVSSKGASGSTITKTVTGSGTSIAEKAAATVPTAIVAKMAAPATVAITDSHGITTGSSVTTVDAAGTATTKKTDLAGKSLGYDVATRDATSVTTQHYSGAGAFTGLDKAVYAADGSVTTQHYNTSFAFTGADRVYVNASGATITEHYSANWAILATEKATTAADGSVTTEYYDAGFKLTHVDKVTTTATAVTTEHYDTAYKLTGLDKVIKNADGTTSVQHYDSGFKLTSVDVIKAAGTTTTTWHYDGAWKLQGTDVATLDSNGVTKTLSYDASSKLVSTSYYGSDRADTLSGSSGTTHFYGGRGGDTLKGGSGVDFFHFDTPVGQGDVDTITSFQVAKDKIVLDHSVFDKIGAVGALDPSVFAIGSAATSAATRIVYDPAKGNLYYDDDGNGAHAPVLLAHIGADAALTASNFIVS